MVTQMEEDVDFDEMMLQRSRQCRLRRRGRIPTLRLHTREDDVSTHENTHASQEIESLEYLVMCGQQRSERTPLFEDIEGGHTSQVATTQEHPTPSSHEHSPRRRAHVPPTHVHKRTVCPVREGATGPELA